MRFDACINKISKYLASENNAQPLLVNVQNASDLNKLLDHFNVGSIVVVEASEFCKDDELPRIETLQDSISSEKQDCFLTGLTSFLRFYGEDEIKKRLASIVNMSISGHIVIITYQCEKQLNFSDLRLPQNICLIEGEKTTLPELVFVSENLPIPSGECSVKGIENVVKIIEETEKVKIYITTKKHKDMFMSSKYSITDMNNAYRIISGQYRELSKINEEEGTVSQWEYLLSKVNSNESFEELCNVEFGNCKRLEIAIPDYRNYPEEKKWLYFIALRIFGAKDNYCLNIAASNALSQSQLIREVYRSILSFEHKDVKFSDIYEERKSLLIALGNPSDKVADFCQFVMQKEKQAIYYLTDSTRQEKELVFTLLEKYYQNSTKEELKSILSSVYPDLAAYISDYRYNLPLLDKYFSLYTQSKLVNKVLPELETMVNQQAISREYNLLLEPRTAKIDKIDNTDSQLYFMDAMGVEYLSYILTKCKEKELMANTTVCCANLPSITSKNKEFVAGFESKGIVINSIKDLDEIKHHGINDYDYRQRKQPIHLIRELEIIDETLDKIKLKLNQGNCQKAIMISDHGASRLAVIHETENMWEMGSKGEHSGRCCPKTDADVQTEYATEEDGFWVLANYDRFKGGRKANVEVHGGATLEEVVVPIIEITKMTDDIEISIVEKIITVSFKKKAAIKLFSKTKLSNLSVQVDGNYFVAQEQDNNMFLVEMPELKKVKQYKVDVFASNNLIASGLSFEIKKESSQEKDLF